MDTVSLKSFLHENCRQLADDFRKPINATIGISEYEIACKQLPKELLDKMPTVEEIESGLNK